MASLRETKESIHLKIFIVGAGIAGLSTAAALRRAGHDITVFIFFANLTSNVTT